MGLRKYVADDILPIAALFHPSTIGGNPPLWQRCSQSKYNNSSDGLVRRSVVRGCPEHSKRGANHQGHHIMTQTTETRSLATTIYLEDRRREAARLMTKIQHLVGGLPLLLTGIQNFKEGVERPLAVLEIGIAVVLLVTFARDAMALRRHNHAKHTTHSGYDWFDLASGVLLLFEAFHSPHQKPAYLRPQFFTGVVMLGFGVLHGRLHTRQEQRRYLKLDNRGLEVRLGPFRRFAIARQNLKSMQLSETSVVLHQVDGKSRTVPLARMRNSAEIRQGLTEYARAAGVRTE
jgi:hypothetical protein